MLRDQCLCHDEVCHHDGASSVLKHAAAHNTCKTTEECQTLACLCTISKCRKARS